MSRIPTINPRRATGKAQILLNGWKFIESSLSRPVLFPVEMFGRKLRNRLAVAPMTRESASGDGLATDRMKDYYREFARGGFAIVITEGTYTDKDASQATTASLVSQVGGKPTPGRRSPMRSPITGAWPSCN
ncbi:MAG: hypothetical protein F9B45_29970 [Phycisphaera sp. RhM]|nr:hypothetical protein [Phycisphaera sp. RhM]